MGLRCSLLGHDFGDVVVERDRDDRGEEIVVTERELRECRRCDAESIITENTEVRRKRPADAEREESPAGGSAAPDGTVTDAEATPEDATSLVEEAEESAAEREREAEDAIILDDTDSEPEPVETQATGTSPGETSPTKDSQAEERATGDSPDEAQPTAGESPAETTTAEEPPDSAEDATEFDGSSGSGSGETAPEDRDSGAHDEDGMITAEEQDGPETAEPVGSTEERDGDAHQWHGEASSPDPEATTADTASESKWPNDPETADRAAQSGGDTEAGSVGEPTDESEFDFGDEATESGPGDPSSGIASAGPIDTTAPPDGGLEGVLRCPACDFAIPIARSANRPGDICPECHAGYLSEER